MAELSGFFDAQNLGTEAEPQWDRAYLAEAFAKYFALFISNGMFPNPPEQLRVVPQTGYNISITIGSAFINGYWYRNTTTLPHAVEATDGVNNRIDRVILRWSKSDRMITSMVLKGVPTLNPVPPALLRNEDYWDLSVAQINITRNSTQITLADITDERYDNAVCGIVHAIVDQIDTTTLYNQIQADLAEYKGQYQSDWLAWSSGQMQAFEEWFETVRNILDENVAATLLSYINRQVFSATAEIDADNAVSVSPSQGQSGSMYEVFFEMPSTVEDGTSLKISGDSVTLRDMMGEPMEINAHAGVPMFLVRKGMDAFMLGGRGGSAGMSANVTVVGGLTQPTNPKENTVWVETEYDITSYAFDISAGALSEGTVGHAIIMSSFSAVQNRINIGKTNKGLFVYPFSAFVWNGISYERAEIKLYKDGQWYSGGGDLYYNGNEFENVTGGWTVVKTAGGSVTKRASDVLVNCVGVNGVNTLGTIRTTNMIDLSAINEIYLENPGWTFGGTSGFAFGLLGVTDNPNAGNHVVMSPNATGAGRLVLDVSGVVGMRYVYVGAGFHGATSYTANGIIKHVHVD